MNLTTKHNQSQSIGKIIKLKIIIIVNTQCTMYIVHNIIIIWRSSDFHEIGFWDFYSIAVGCKIIITL